MDINQCFVFNQLNVWEGRLKILKCEFSQNEKKRPEYTFAYSRVL